MKPSHAVLLAGLLLALAAASCSSGDNEKQSAKARPQKAASLKINQFYASAPAIARGDQALLCYGVENARAVRITPGVEPVSPAYNRCIQVSPKDSTTYTLTAEGEDGSTATATLTLQVVRGAKPQAPAQAGGSPAESAGPVIRAFRTEKKPGLTLLCYEVDGAEAASIEPHVLPRSGALRGCLGVAPKAPTTYTLTAYGSGGKTVSRTLEVAP